jgi:hypothetical protein
MVSRLDFDVLKGFFNLAPKQEKRSTASAPRSVTLHMGHQRRWSLKRTESSSTCSHPSFCWTKTRAS